MYDALSNFVFLHKISEKTMHCWNKNIRSTWGLVFLSIVQSSESFNSNSPVMLPTNCCNWKRFIITLACFGIAYKNLYGIVLNKIETLISLTCPNQIPLSIILTVITFMAFSNSGSSCSKPAILVYLWIFFNNNSYFVILWTGFISRSQICNKWNQRCGSKWSAAQNLWTHS